MPALPDVANVLKIVFSGSFSGASWANVMHAKWFGTTPSNSDLSTIAGLLATDYDTRFGALLADDLLLENVEITDLTNTSASRGLWAGSLAGADTGDLLPASCAAVISWGIARRYRGGHPRTYLCGLTVNARQNARLLTAAKQIAIATAAGAFIGDVAGTASGPITSLELGQVSYYSGGVPRVVPLFDPFITGGSGLRIDSQRRRLGTGS